MTLVLEQRPELLYIELRAALDYFSKPLGSLSDDERKIVRNRALKAYDIGARALASSEARDIHVPEGQVIRALQEIESRYPEPKQFQEELRHHGLDREALRQALYRELRLEVLLERVAARAEPVTDEEVTRYYECHKTRLERPETRTVRQILITINPDYPENTSEAARARLEMIRDTLLSDLGTFADLAMRHSECPSALKGGLLGRMPEGNLYPELDDVLFKMAAGTVSDPVQTEVGLHLLYCETIHPPGLVTLDEAGGRIRQVLEQRRQANCRRAWLESLG
ncbi:nitrogen fixation protein NifM [Ectothiorhodospira lacustris]|uniref:nitrogen fixation protein NifM n=1 Tax=Ectothiorhodospira lacustris TaxID=2899127 RepID=UPI001EE9A4BD|nr:nitrogen fixation protein NifM [Ectothiorhodospira lacustris]MCG5501965.1 nitrogen fixation protein NifM [Ectothiorhodospira lacustris]MCG5510459.1 nitrogen fixation protein NifM [Ectothiorhodospira lacustris]MCG5522205.1 nitrogen fixation protein NifM [Ectothiorhodospira lacustris]